MVGLNEKVFPIKNVKSIEIKQGVTKIVYQDNTTRVIKGDLLIVSDYKNENDYPIVDHCI